MESRKALVSVLLLGWNHERFIDKCVRSIAQQTYKSIEIIFLDNNSSDATYEIGVACLQASSIPFKSFRNTEGKSIAKNLNFLLEQSTGLYIIPLSTDDWLEPDCIAQKIDYYERYPEVGMLYSKGWIFFEDQDKLIEADSKNFKRGKITQALLCENEVLFFIGICYKRSVLEELGGWDEQLLIEDLDMFIRISLRYDIDYVPKPLAYYRKISTSAANNVEFMIKGWEQYYQKYKGAGFVDMDVWLAEKYRAYAAVLSDRDRIKDSLRLCIKSFQKDVLNIKTYKTLLYLIRRRIKRKTSFSYV